MTDRYREATTLYQNALDADHRTSTDAAITLIATALSDAYEAGRREEREACAEVADNEKAAWDGDLSIMAFSARKAAEDIAAAIHARAIEDVKK
ncbi:hypothetical protein [Gellertiella hungarica]|uniref:Uncharacterized protein n=1 Tax=Gellertiella hungarica TaxID=1572859 RepID=A0A7W6J3Z5_9HYPH|nr:hypothetical protein [Gellertiella hungarica]MBB4063632.1 hypothetical protein [Gellertiella hungarica]